MLNFSPKQKFYGTIVLSTIILIFIHLNSEKPRLKANGEFSSLLEKVRTLGIKDRMTEVRRVRTNSPWLKADLSELINFLQSGKDSQEEILTPNQLINAVKSIENSGREASAATAVIQKLILETNSIELKKIALLGMIRIKSSEESIFEVLDDICDNDKKGSRDLCDYRALINYRFDNLKDLNKKKQIDKLKGDLSQSISRLVPDSEKLNSDFSEYNFGDEDREFFYKSSLIGSMSEDGQKELYKIAISSYPTEKRILALNTLLDQIDLSDDLIMKISDLMQYDVKYEIREAALLGLSRLDNQKGLTQVHAYGHKFLNGETRPTEIEPHPFIKWALRENI